MGERQGIGVNISDNTIVMCITKYVNVKAKFQPKQANEKIDIVSHLPWLDDFKFHIFSSF